MLAKDPTPQTVTDELLVQVRDELRTLNKHLAGDSPAKPKTRSKTAEVDGR